MKKIFLLIIFLSLSFAIFAQQRYPVAVLPGDQYLVKPVEDTLWVITDSQLNRALIAVKELKNADLQLENYRKQLENLNKQLAEKDSILELTQKNRDYYEKNWKDCSNNLKVLVEENQKEANKLKAAKIIGGVATVAAFILGAYIF